MTGRISPCCDERFQRRFDTTAEETGGLLTVNGSSGMADDGENNVSVRAE